MDSLKLIPSVFFDIIARVVPGSVAMIAYLYFAHTTWSQVLAQYLGTAFAGENALLVSTILFFMTAYVAGQLLSPFAKGVQRIAEKEYFRWKKEPKKFKWKMAPKKKAPKGAYDWLRVHHKDAGAQCAKIRAEFMMHNGLFVTVVASLVWSLFFVCPRDWLLIAALTLFAVSTAIRGRTTSDTYDETVRKLSEAADYRPPPSKPPEGAPQGEAALANGPTAMQLQRVPLFRDWAFWFLFFPSLALWLMTIAVFASNCPIHFSSHKDDVITEAANPNTYWSLKFGLLLVTLAFSIAALLRYRAVHRANRLTNQ